MRIQTKLLSGRVISSLFFVRLQQCAFLITAIIMASMMTLSVLQFKWVLSVIAIAITLYVFVPYIISILKGQTRPHVFSWVIWALTTLVVFLAQLDEKGGAGAWPVGLSGMLTLCVAALAFWRSDDTQITLLDWAFFIAALVSIPLWFVLSDPMWSVILLTLVDLLGFGPTFRKAYDHPFDERIFFYFIYAVRNVLVVGALEHYTVATLLFPIAVGGACLFLCGVIYVRRKSHA